MSHSFYKRVLQREERWLEEEAREARDPRLGQESPYKHRYVKDANMSCSAIGGRPALLAANPVCMLSPVASVDRSPQGNRYIDSLKSPSRRRSGSQSPSRRRSGSPRKAVVVNFFESSYASGSKRRFADNEATHQAAFGQMNADCAFMEWDDAGDNLIKQVRSG